MTLIVTCDRCQSQGNAELVKTPIRRVYVQHEDIIRGAPTTDRLKRFDLCRDCITELDRRLDAFLQDRGAGKRR